jgi:hypothetical protein
MQVTHTYDVHPRLTAVTGSTAERGPLAASNEIVVAGAVDRGSQGPSARSHLSRAVGAATDYDRMTRPAQINTRWAKTGLATEAVDGVLSHPAHLGVAANTASTYDELRKAGLTDAHHIIQDAAVRDVPGYSRGSAPAIQLTGPSTTIGSPPSERLVEEPTERSDRSQRAHLQPRGVRQARFLTP